MILNNLILKENDKAINLKIENQIISVVSSSKISSQKGELELEFDKAMVYPGLINSHDHLDFNLFPQLGSRTYYNYIEWGEYIHKHYKREIDSVLKIPRKLRIQWGVYKNLISGVTTVIHHGEKTGLRNELIHVIEEFNSIHSVGLDKKWALRLNHPLKSHLPVNIHIGEGIDSLAKKEIDQLIQWNILKRKLIGVHGVSMNETQARKFKALIWCPQSNYFLINKTAEIDRLKHHTRILFGSDSTLSSEWNIWKHIQTARKTNLLSDLELYHSLNQYPAEVWKLNTGRIEPGRDADLIITENTIGMGLESYFSINPEDLLLVMYKGEIRLYDEKLKEKLIFPKDRFSSFKINGVKKYIQGNLTELMEEIRKYYPEAAFLA